MTLSQQLRQFQSQLNRRMVKTVVPALAAPRRDELGIEWKCRNRHDILPTAKFCDQCGAPARQRLRSHRAGV